MLYEIRTSRLYADDEQPTSLSRLAGSARGVCTEQWPTMNGHPMQHLFTIDLQDLELDVAAARDARLLVVFAMAFYELDEGITDAVAMRWVSQEALERTPVSSLPDGYEVIGALEDSPFEAHETLIELEQSDDEPSYYDDFVGGVPVWTELGEPEAKPAGAFIMQVSSGSFPITRSTSELFLFEGGALIQRHEALEEDESAAVPWDQAVAASRELAIGETPPEPDAVQKWGGIPRGVPQDAWFEGNSHLFTFETSVWYINGEPVEDVVAAAVFANLEELEWDEQPCFEVVPIYSDNLDEIPEPPEDATVLPERRLEQKPFAEGATYHDLRLASFVGPRLAWRAPEGAAFEEGTHGIQLTDAVLTIAPVPGTLYLECRSDANASWQPVGGQAQSSGRAQHLAPVDGLNGTLFEEETEAAIVIGHQLTISAEHFVTVNELVAFGAAVKEANEEHGLDLELIVPGDTFTDDSMDIPSTVLLGFRIARMDASDAPMEIDRDSVLEAIASFPELADAYWATLEEQTDELQADKDPAVYLASYGPLSYGALYIGRPLPASQSDDAIYEFASSQDMEQEPNEAGVDGVLLASVEQEIDKLDWSTEAHLSNLNAVVDLKVRWYMLACSYD